MGKKQNINYIFKEKLIEGVIKERKNRFIIKVIIDQKEYDCHCPSSGKIAE